MIKITTLYSLQIKLTLEILNLPQNVFPKQLFLLLFLTSLKYHFTAGAEKLTYKFNDNISL